MRIELLENSIELSALNDLTRMLKTGTKASARLNDYAKLYISASAKTNTLSLYYTNGIVAMRYSTSKVSITEYSEDNPELNIAIPLLNNNKFAANKIRAITLPVVMNSGVSFHGVTSISQILVPVPSNGFQDKIQQIFDKSSSNSIFDSIPAPDHYTLDYGIVSDLLKFYRKFIGNKKAQFILAHAPDTSGACKISGGAGFDALLSYYRMKNIPKEMTIPASELGRNAP